MFPDMTKIVAKDRKKSMKLSQLENADFNIAVIGLGYVGLPIALEFSKHFRVVGFDINPQRIENLKAGVDATQESNRLELESAGDNLVLTSCEGDISQCSCFIITVPTPIDEFKRPDLTPLLSASETVGRCLKNGDLVIYESTVYPGATEEDCVPVLEQVSGLKFNRDFHVGYSPERVNPGDREHRLNSITKVTAGSTSDTAEFVDKLYQKIILAGTHKTESIRIAEASKVIENTQRDINIALINELAMIFNKMGLDTEAILKAAGTKWNFLPFWPGLVGGHCIGVDPFYLTHKAQSIGCHPKMILAGREINDSMGVYVASQLMKKVIGSRVKVNNIRVLLMGFAFKENCPDLRNTRVVDILDELKDYGWVVDVYDPVVDCVEVKMTYGFNPIDEPKNGVYDAIIIAVAHDEFKKMGAKAIRKFGKKQSIVYDLKYILKANESDIRL